MKALKLFPVIIFILILSSCSETTYVPSWALESDWYGALTPQIALKPELEVTIKGDTLITHHYAYYENIDDLDTTFIEKIHYSKDNNTFVALPFDRAYIDTLNYYRYHYSFVNIRGNLALKLEYEAPVIDKIQYLFPKEHMKFPESMSNYIQTEYRGYKVGDKVEDLSNFEAHDFNSSSDYFEYAEDGKSKRENVILKLDDNTGLTGLKLTVVNDNVVYRIEQEDLSEFDANKLIMALNAKFNTPNNRPQLDSIVYGGVYPTDYYKECEWNDGSVKIWQDLVGKEPDGWFSYNLRIDDHAVKWLISTKTDRRSNAGIR